MENKMTALDRLKTLKNGWQHSCYSADLAPQRLIDDLETIERLLTPPTSEEVCKALSEHDEIDVKHERGENLDVFYYGIIKHDMNHKEYIQKRIICIGDNSEINLNASLPPHLIELIGRFYGGLK